MRRRAAGPPVALFPFLAVLLCAMGALILLLIILTRQIREDVLSAATPEDRPATPAPEQVVLESIPTVRVVLPAPVQEVPADPNVALREQLAMLAGEKANLRREVERIRRVVADCAADIRSQEAKIASAAFDVDASQQRLDARNIGLQEREAERRRLVEAVRHAEGNLTAARRAADAAEPKVSIVPYDGQYGTARRPILIECTERAIRFLPEGIELSASDIEGYQSDYNPLLAGVVALRQHWKDVDGPSAPRPYVLLIVREGGVAAYYAARAMLQSFDSETGYELVTDGVTLDVPEVDATARNACQTAVAEVLKNRTPTEARLMRGDPLFPSGRFVVDPIEHDPTQTEPSSFAGRPTVDRNRPAPPPAKPLGRSAGLADRRMTPGSATAHRPTPGPSPSTSNAFADANRRPTDEKSAARVNTGDAIEPTDSVHDDTIDAGLPMFGITSTKHRWGVNNPTANISLERPVAILVTDDNVTVGVQPPIPIESGIDAEAVHAVLAAIEKEAVGWGRAPGQFYWSPRLFAKVRPGGTGHFDQLRLALGRAGLRTSGEIELAPSSPAFLELNHGEAAP